jgi:hypothetical protein
MAPNFELVRLVLHVLGKPKTGAVAPSFIETPGFSRDEFVEHIDFMEAERLLRRCDAPWLASLKDRTQLPLRIPIQITSQGRAFRDLIDDDYAFKRVNSLMQFSRTSQSVADWTFYLAREWIGRVDWEWRGFERPALPAHGASPISALRLISKRIELHSENLA